MNQIQRDLIQPPNSAFELLVCVIEHNATYAEPGSPYDDADALASIWLPIFRSERALDSALSAVLMCIQEQVEVRPCLGDPIVDGDAE